MYEAEKNGLPEFAQEQTDALLAEVLSDYQAKPFAWWRIGISVLVVICGVIMMQILVKWSEMSRLSKGSDHFFLSDKVEKEIEGRVISEEKKKLSRWKLEPENKGYFMDYVLSLPKGERMPIEEMLTNAERIDPDNSFYYYLAASFKMKSKKGQACVERIKSKGHGLLLLRKLIR